MKYQCKEIICPICGEKMTQYNIKMHMNKYHGISKDKYEEKYENKKFKCEICGKRFKTETSLLKHKSSAHGLIESHWGRKRKEIKENSKIKCQICEKIFFDLKSLSKHIKKEHPEIKVEEYWLKYLNPENKTDKCKQCGSPVKFKGLGKGYNDFCSFSCSTKWYAENTDRIERAMKTFEERKEIYKEQGFGLNSVHKDYWLYKGYTEEESLKKIKERQTTFTKEICIEKYGEEEGLKRWKGRQKKWQNTINSKPLEELERIHKAKQCNGRGFSKISQKLFNEINEKIKKLKLSVYFAENQENGNNFYGNGEYFQVLNNKRVVLYDFYIPELNYVVEFDGDYWHGERRGNQERDRLREKDILETNPNLIIRHVKERDFKNNKQEVINEIVNEITELINAHVI